MDTPPVLKSASSVETSVTKLLISTKQLLQVLTQWSKGKSSERNVSDVYVQLGNDFKLVSRHFTHAGVDISDLGDVPKDLRRILEVALRETASEDTLNKYLPQIREIIVRLLEKLKVKQALIKLNRNEDSTKFRYHQKQRSSVSSVVSNTTSLADTSPTVRSTSLAKPTSKSLNEQKSAPVLSLSEASTTDKDQNSIQSSTAKPVGEQKHYDTLEVPTSSSESDALTQLKKGNNLQRRASKRFSAYHMAKLANQTAADPANSPSSKSLAKSTSINLTENESNNTRTEDHVRSRVSSSASVELHPFSGEQEASGSFDDNSNPNGSHNNIVIFLKVGNKVKRCFTSSNLSFNKLRLLFVEKFAYSPGGDIFPEIYIREPKYEAFYELEESQLHNIKDGSIFQLQIPAPSLEQQLQQLNEVVVEKQASFFENIKTLIQEISTHPTTPSNHTSGIINQTKSSDSSTVVDVDHHQEIAQIKHEMTILKQIHSSQKKTLENTITDISEKLQKFQSLSVTTGKSANRDYMEKSQSKLSEVSDNLLSKVDELQDVIEALRKDVAIRGARPPKKKIENVSLDLESAKNDLERMSKYIEVEKPNWKTIWEAELDRVCEEQQFMTLQEDLVFDLQEDLKKVLETFELVKMCCEQQEKAPKKNKGNPILPIAKPGTFNMIRDQVLYEVQSLNPDHDSRVEAIKKAEKLREREREYRENEAFEDELGNFVEKGNFKKAGGIEEIEKLRKQKDEENLRMNFGML